MAFLGVTQPLPLTAFGELNTGDNYPRIQLQFPYNINLEEINTEVTGSGNNNISFDVSSLNAVLNPGNTLTIAGTSSGAASTAAASLMWMERF